MIILFLVPMLYGCSPNKDTASTHTETDASPALPTSKPTPQPSSVDMAETACPMTPNAFSSLSVPTQITHIGEDYFLVDCYHNQILTSPTLDKPLEEWYVLSDQINRGHTIAGNGSLYVADDTENHRVLVFQKDSNGFLLTQIFENIGNRPHYVEYDPHTGHFYVLSSMSGELYVFSQPDNMPELCLEQIMTIPGMQNVYIRSFTLMDGEIYFAASNGTILRCNLTDLSILESWTLPDELAGLVQVVKLDDYFYLTVSTDKTGNPEYATIIRTRDLSYLQDNSYETLYETFSGVGTPYYISTFNGHCYLTHHCNVPGHGVWQFDVTENTLVGVTALYP